MRSNRTTGDRWMLPFEWPGPGCVRPDPQLPTLDMSKHSGVVLDNLVWQWDSASPEFAGQLREAFPGLGPFTPTGVLGRGFGGFALDTQEGWVVRVLMDRDWLQRLDMEASFLKALQGRVPAAVPDLQCGTLFPRSSFPIGVIIYRRIEGVPLDQEALSRGDAERLARDVAEFLLALHRFPIEDAGALGLPTPEEREAALWAMREDLFYVLNDLLTTDELTLVGRWWAGFLQDPLLRSYPASLVHGDLWYENILVDDAARRVVGVIDFDSAHIGDPAQDIATQLHLGARFASRVLEAYRAGSPPDEHLAYRAWRLWEFREFGGIHLASRQGNSEELADAVRKLRAGPVLNPAARGAAFV